MFKRKVKYFTIILLSSIIILSIVTISGISFDTTPMTEENSSDSHFIESNESGIEQESIENKIHDVVNEERTERGLSKLSHDEEIREISRYKSTNMIENNYFAHTSPDGETVIDRFEQHSYNDCSVVGENLAQTFYNTNVDKSYNDNVEKYTTEDELAQGVVNQFIASPEHKEALFTDEWDRQGIGFVMDDETVYVTQKFCEL